MNDWRKVAFAFLYILAAGAIYEQLGYSGHGILADLFAPIAIIGFLALIPKM